MAASSILIVTPDPATAEGLRDSLVAEGHRVEVAASTGGAPENFAGHDVLLLAGLATEAAAETCRLVKEAAAGGGPGICILTATDDVEVRVALLQAGADEVLPESVDPRELDARLGALVMRFDRAARIATAGTATASPPRRVIAVFSPSGGVGTTTIAVNLGLALLAHHPRRVAVIDLHLPFGQVATHLDLRPTRSIVDLVADEPALHDPSQLVAYATLHSSGLSVYATPTAWAAGPDLTPATAVAIIETASLAHDRVVVDMGSATDERAIAVLVHADTVVLPVRPEIPALRAIRSIVDVLEERGMNLERVVFVLSREFGREIILKPRDIETFLGRPADADLPYDPIIYGKAANQGVPILIAAPSSAPAEALTRLADIASGGQTASHEESPPAPTDRRPPGRFGGLFGSRG